MLNDRGYNEAFSGKNFGRLVVLQQSTSNVTFKLLAVEGDFDQVPMHSAAQLIRNLTIYNNWRNGSGYMSYIHLLSIENYTGTDMERYFKGTPHKQIIKNEIVGFLNRTFPGEDPNSTVRIFYYIGHTNREGPRVGIQAATCYNITWIDELKSLLHPSSGPLSNSNSTVIVLDTCYSGAYIQNLTTSGTVVLTSSCPDQLSNGWLDVTTPQCLMPGHWGWFTGHENACYSNGTHFGPLGIIGAIRNETGIDENHDGWESAAEIFRFASNTTLKYSYGQLTINSSRWQFQLPQRGYGLAGGAIPLVQYNSSSSFPGFPSRITPVKTINKKFGQVFPMPEPPVLICPWPMFGRDPSRTGASPVVGPTFNSSAWSHETHVPISSSPATTYEGMAFVINDDGEMHAVDFRNGKSIWTLGLNAPVFSSPTSANGLVFAATLKGGNPSGRLYAVDVYSGEPRWMFEFPSDTEAFASPTIMGETIYVATIGPPGSVMGAFALNMFTGEVLWFHQTLAPVYSSPAVADGMVFFATNWDGTNMAYVYALNYSTGDKIWNYPLGETLVISSPAVSLGRVYIGIMGGINSQPQILALNELGGNFEWNFTTSTPVSSSPAVDTLKRLIIAAGDDGTVYALSAEDGSQIWNAPAGPVNMSSPAISNNDLIYIGSEDGTLYCLNETNGQQVWRYLTADEIISSPALTQEHVLFASKDGNLYCIGPPFPIHDVAVSSLQVHPTMITRGELVYINFTITNLGNRAETFNVTIAYNTTAIWTPPEYNEPVTIHTQEVMLQPGQSVCLNYQWQTNKVNPGTYTILATAELVNSESDPLNNVYLNGTIKIEEYPTEGGGGRRFPPFCLN